MRNKNLTAALPAEADGYLRDPQHRARHGRKTAFWSYVNGTRRDRHDEADDLDL